VLIGTEGHELDTISACPFPLELPGVVMVVREKHCAISQFIEKNFRIGVEIQIRIQITTVREAEDLDAIKDGGRGASPAILAQRTSRLDLQKSWCVHFEVAQGKDSDAGQRECLEEAIRFVAKCEHIEMEIGTVRGKALNHRHAMVDEVDVEKRAEIMRRGR